MPIWPLTMRLILHPGIRVSLYNAITEQEVDKMVAFMTQFIEDLKAV